jgi:hypothetical protein
MNQFTKNAPMQEQQPFTDKTNVFLESIVPQDLEVRALNFEVKEIGEVFESSKHHLSWLFTINGGLHKVELFDSLLTNRRVVVVDSVETVDTGRVGWFGDSDFRFETTIDNCSIEITHPPKADFFYLKINGTHFNKLLAAEKSRKRVSKHQKAKDNHVVSKQFFERETAKNMEQEIDYAKIRSAEKVIEIDIDEEMLDRAFGQDDNKGLMATPFDDDF